MGEYSYKQIKDDLPIVGMMWVGQVGSDMVVILSQSGPENVLLRNSTMYQILDTIDFNPK